MSKQYLVTGQAEYYVYVQADSAEEAKKKARASKEWSRTMNLPLAKVKAAVYRVIVK